MQSNLGVNGYPGRSSNEWRGDMTISSFDAADKESEGTSDACTVRLAFVAAVVGSEYADVARLHIERSARSFLCLIYFVEGVTTFLFVSSTVGVILAVLLSR